MWTKTLTHAGVVALLLLVCAATAISVRHLPGTTKDSHLDAMPDVRGEAIAPTASQFRFSDSDRLISQAARGVANFDLAESVPARFEPHGHHVCASGCALSHHPTEKLSESRFAELLQQCVRAPLDANNAPFETLLFYSNQARELFDRQETHGISAAHASVIRRELSRSHVRVSLRLIDDSATVRARLSPTNVPLDRRHVFTLNSTDLPHLVASGTVKRVGLHHLWTRL